MVNNNTLMTLSEEGYEILTMYMARVDAEENYSVHFSAKDLKNIFGDNFTAQRIQQCLNDLMGIVVDLCDEMVTLFDSARVYRDDEQLCMDLTCTPTAHTYFFGGFTM